MTHSRERCTPLAWELLLQEIPHSLPLHQVQWSACTWLSISTACPGSFLLSPLPGDLGCGEMSGGPCGSGSHKVNRAKASAGCQLLPSDVGRSAPVLHPTQPLAPRDGAWRSARQGDFSPLSMALVLTDFSSAPEGDNAALYNLLDFLKLHFLALQFKFDSCCLDTVCSSCFAMNCVGMK